MTSQTTKRFTGRHAAIVICSGFAIVIGVNTTLGVLASRSHPGMVVENSYVASQNFNKWLADGRAQQSLGWTISTEVDGEKILFNATDKQGTPITGLTGHITISHPIQSQNSQQVDVRELGAGLYASPTLPTGQWIAEIRVTKGDDRFYQKQRIAIGGK